MLNLYGVDIETDTTGGGGLDPAGAAVTEIALDVPGNGHVFTGDERIMFSEFRGYLASLPSGLVVTWNGAVFDAPFLVARASMLDLDLDIVLQYDPQIPVKYAPLPGHPGGYRVRFGQHRHIDISGAYKQLADELGVKHSLKPVYEAVTGKKPITVERTKMHLLSPAERQEYALSDSRITVELATRLGEEYLLAHADSI
jgi:DNA polymerase elongation subunit (family B)